MVVMPVPLPDGLEEGGVLLGVLTGAAGVMAVILEHISESLVDVAIPVYFAAIVALPLAFFGNRLWLQIFANPVDPSLWLFAGCAVLVGLLALAIITSQTLRASSINPADCLRLE